MQNWYLRSKSRYAEYIRFDRIIDNRIAPNIRDMLFSVVQEEKVPLELAMEAENNVEHFLDNFEMSKLYYERQLGQIGYLGFVFDCEIFEGVKIDSFKALKDFLDVHFDYCLVNSDGNEVTFEVFCRAAMSRDIDLVDLLCASCLDDNIPELLLADKPSLKLIRDVLMKRWNAKPRCSNGAYGIFIDVVAIDTGKSLNTYFTSSRVDDDSNQIWLCERYENAIKPFIEEHKALGDLTNWKLKFRIAELS